MSDTENAESGATSEDVPWFDISEWSLRRKLALALAIPMLLAATFGGMRVVGAAQDAANFAQLESRVGVLQPTVRLVDSTSAMVVAGRGADQAAVQRTRTAFDAAAVDLRSAIGEAGIGEEQTTALTQALAAAQGLRDSPADAPAATVSSQFGELVTLVGPVLSNLTGETSDTRLTTIRDILAGQVALTEQRLLTTSRDGLQKVDALALGNAIGEEATAITALEGSLGATNSFVDALASGNELRLTAAPEVAAGTSALPRAQDASSVYTNLADRVTGDVVETMSDRAADARATAIRDSIFTLGLLAVAVGLALAVARMLLDPIRRVREGALDIAQVQLPAALTDIRAGKVPAPVEPLPVHTGEETGQLARAVDTLHSEAIHLATEQARLREQVRAMFETLSRRSTSLINQQLGVIEVLEREEDDPRRLESLFRLDHLAARIRRNGDSLLVLAGAPSRTIAGADLPLGDVVRAAISEVQDYQRVRLSVTDLVIPAEAAPDLVHLFAELIDNALAYSPPESRVNVLTLRGIDGGTLVEIVDQGLGMTPEDMSATNASLVTGGEVTTETARRMGLYVVGQLAARHGVTVHLRANPDGSGTIASVMLPSALLNPTQAAPEPSTGATDGDDVTVLQPSADPGSPEATGAPAGSPTGRPRLTAVPGQLSTLRSELATRVDPITGPMPRITPTMLPPVVGTPPAVDGAETRADSGPLDDTGPQSTQTDDVAAGSESGLPRRRPGATGAGAAPFGTDASPAGPARPAWAVRKPAAPTDTSAETPSDAGRGDGSLPALPRRDGFGALGALRAREAEGAEATKAAKAAKAGEDSLTRPNAPASTQPAPAPAPDTGADDERTWSEADFPAADPHDPSQPTPLAETPIFTDLQSSWLTENDDELPWASESIDEGWLAAERVAAKEVDSSAGTSASGLPVRRPGSSLVPGQTGVGRHAATARDPEAIRAHLNRHLAGVRRGRLEGSTDSSGSTGEPAGNGAGVATDAAPDDDAMVTTVGATGPADPTTQPTRDEERDRS